MSKEIDLIKCIISEIDDNLYSDFGCNPCIRYTPNLKKLLLALDTPEVRHFFENCNNQAQQITDLEAKLTDRKQFCESQVKSLTDIIAGLIETKHDLEAKIEEKEKEISQLYPFIREYHNGIFVEYNVIYERNGIVATTSFGRNKERAYDYLKTLRKDVKVVSQNQKAIAELEKLNEEFNQPYSDDVYTGGQIERIIDQQISNLKGDE